jgi:hypothetical protein
LGLSASNSPSAWGQQQPTESLRQRASTTGNVAVDSSPANTIPNSRPITYGGVNQAKAGLESLTSAADFTSSSLKHRGSLDVRNDNVSLTPTSATQVKLNESLRKQQPEAVSASPSETSTCSTATTVRNVHAPAAQQPHLGLSGADEDDENEFSSGKGKFLVGDNYEGLPFERLKCLSFVFYWSSVKSCVHSRVRQTTSI